MLVRSTSTPTGAEEQRVSSPGYREVAADLRDSISRGDYPPGAPIPNRFQIMDQWGVSSTTARNAVRLLVGEGLVTPIRKRGTIVRERTARRQVTRSRTAYRDEIGYYFDPAAQGWRALHPPVIEYRPAPPDIAPLLGLDAGTEVLVRDRVLGDPETETPMQIATSYLPADLVRGTALEQRDTGPGGIYDRLERDMGYGPLQWTERISARMPHPAEAEALALDPGTPVLCITRVTTDDEGSCVLEVNDTRMSADTFDVGYEIDRDPSAVYDVST